MIKCVGMKNNISEYKHYRKIGMKLNGKLVKELSRSDMKNAARLLGLLKKNTFIMDSEEEIDRFTEFAINDYHNISGKTTVQTYKENNIDALKNTGEEQILESLLIAKPSLYKITDVNKKTSTVYLSDEFNNSEEIIIIDIGLSSSTKIKGFLLFSRIVSIGQIKMTSGAPLLFEKSKETVLREKYKKLYKKITLQNEQTKMAIVFFKLSQRLGYNVQHITY